jgi:hypothetical protein
MKDLTPLRRLDAVLILLNLSSRMDRPQSITIHLIAQKKASRLMIAQKEAQRLRYLTYHTPCPPRLLNALRQSEHQRSSSLLTLSPVFLHLLPARVLNQQSEIGVFHPTLLFQVLPSDLLARRVLDRIPVLISVILIRTMRHARRRSPGRAAKGKRLR